MGIIDLLSNPIIGFLGTVGTVLGIVLTVVFYRKEKRDKEPHWAIQTVNLFKDYSGTVAGLDIQYQGDKVQNLSVSKIAFWNHGKLTIDATDLTQADPLRLEIKGTGRILSTKLISRTNAASEPLLSRSLERNQAFLKFEYLDCGQGFVIQIIHEGTSSNDLELKGAIKGAAQIRKLNPSPSLNKPKKERSKEPLGFVWSGLGCLVLGGATGWLAAIWQWQWKIVNAIWPNFMLLGICMFGFGLIAYFRMVLGRHVPSGLEAFYTDPRQPGT